MIDSLEIARRLQEINDNGPFYNEFIHDACVHEPWNAYSSLIFFLPIIFWLWRLKGIYAKHKIFLILLPLLFLNGLGSTLFHAFRSSPFLHLLDWLPASLMSFSLASYFWYKILKNWWKSALLVLGFYVIAFLCTQLLIQIENLASYAPNVGYFFVGASLLTPILVLLVRTKFYKIFLVVLSFIFLGTALLFRVLDYPTPNPLPDLLPQGTHFLWHVFSSFAVFTLGYYVFFLNKHYHEFIEN
jgi:membrane protein required for beta-lactamase induction